jgi:hypothetical protein
MWKKKKLKLVTFKFKNNGTKLYIS